MRVVVVGATGNVGTALLRALDACADVTSVLGVSRRIPAPVDRDVWSAKVAWLAADITRDRMDFVENADAVVHLAWLIQPSRDEGVMRATNLDGSRRLFDAVAERRVPSLIYASSVGAYAPASKSRRHDEAWPATGIATSTYSRHKAAVETMLDDVERDHPQLRVVRMRTSLVFQRSAASEVHRLFLGSLLPWHLPRPLRLVPGVSRLMFQATHADDIASAYLEALRRDVAGAFNVAAEPTLTMRRIAEAVAGRVVPMPERVLRAAVAVSYAARVQPSEPGWLDMAVQAPLMDSQPRPS